jgi:hypothetical protein
LPSGNLDLIVATAPTAVAANLLRLRKLALKRFDLDEADVRASLGMTISCSCV